MGAFVAGNGREAIQQVGLQRVAHRSGEHLSKLHYIWTDLFLSNFL
jgi:hypothetical protein